MKLRLCELGNSEAPASASVNCGLGKLRTGLAGSGSGAARSAVGALMWVLSLSCGLRLVNRGGELVEVDMFPGNRFALEHRHSGVHHRRRPADVDLSLAEVGFTTVNDVGDEPEIPVGDTERRPVRGRVLRQHRHEREIDQSVAELLDFVQVEQISGGAGAVIEVDLAVA